MSVHVVTSGALAARVDEGTQADGGVGHDHLEHGVKLAVMEVDAAFPEGVEVGKDTLDPCDASGIAGDMDSVGAEIDGDVQAIFEEAKVFVVGAVERLDTGSDFDGLSYQVCS